jgi:hypothetical protein
MTDDVRDTFAALHHQVVTELLHLLDGFFVNLEYGLFEMADRLDDEALRTRSFNLMREMRHQRPRILRTFTRLLEADQVRWTEPCEEIEEDEALHRHAGALARKGANHLRPVLHLIAERTAYATDRHAAEVQLPISPVRLTYNFLRSCRLLEADETFAEMVNELFSRFVLDRLGTVYGRCNDRLGAAGFLSELEAGRGEDSSAAESAGRSGREVA